jgi:hypothetical protein
VRERVEGAWRAFSTTWAAYAWGGTWTMRWRVSGGLTTAARAQRWTKGPSQAPRRAITLVIEGCDVCSMIGWRRLRVNVIRRPAFLFGRGWADPCRALPASTYRISGSQQVSCLSSNPAISAVSGRASSSSCRQSDAVPIRAGRASSSSDSSPGLPVRSHTGWFSTPSSHLAPLTERRLGPGMLMITWTC